MFVGFAAVPFNLSGFIVVECEFGRSVVGVESAACLVVEVNGIGGVDAAYGNAAAYFAAGGGKSTYAFGQCGYRVAVDSE